MNIKPEDNNTTISYFKEEIERFVKEIVVLLSSILEFINTQPALIKVIF